MRAEIKGTAEAVPFRLVGWRCVESRGGREADSLALLGMTERRASATAKTKAEAKQTQGSFDCGRALRMTGVVKGKSYALSRRSDVR